MMDNPIAQQALARARKRLGHEYAQEPGMPLGVRTTPPVAKPTQQERLDRVMYIEGFKAADALVDSLEPFLKTPEGCLMVLDRMEKLASERPPSFAAGIRAIMESVKGRLNGL